MEKTKQFYSIFMLTEPFTNMCQIFMRRYKNYSIQNSKIINKSVKSLYGFCVQNAFEYGLTFRFLFNFNVLRKTLNDELSISLH